MDRSRAFKPDGREWDSPRAILLEARAERMQEYAEMMVELAVAISGELDGIVELNRV